MSRSRSWGLDRTEVEQLLEAVADQTVSAAFVAAITAETSGNPFFIREVLLHLVEEAEDRSPRGTLDLEPHRSSRWGSRRVCGR